MQEITIKWIQEKVPDRIVDVDVEIRNGKVYVQTTHVRLVLKKNPPIKLKGFNDVIRAEALVEQLQDMDSTSQNKGK